MVKLNTVKQRMVYLAPAVQAGWDDQSSIHDFQFLKMLGKGSFGIVKKVKHKKSGKVYAIKELDKKEIRDRKMAEQVRNEIKIMYSLNHPHIIKLFSHFEDDISIYLIMEFAQKGQLYQNLLASSTKKYSEVDAARIVYQIVDAMKCMHDRGIAHRDIKPQNILLDGQSNAKLADFGWSNYINPQDKRTTYCGTLDYLAPEMIDKQHKHDCGVDLWAIGVLIYELTTGMSPFSSNAVSKVNVEKQVKNNILQLKYKVPTFLSNSCRDLIQCLLVKNPAERLSAYGITQHSWMKANYVSNDMSKPNWSEELKKQFSKIMEVQSKSNIQIKDKAFTVEEIYEYNRLESIINAQLTKIDTDGSITPKDVHGHVPLHCSHSQGPLAKQNHSSSTGNQSFILMTKIKELQAKNKQYQMEIQKYKKAQHTECQKKRAQIQANYMALKKKFDSQFVKLTTSQARVRELELQLTKINPKANLKTEPQ